MNEKEMAKEKLKSYNKGYKDAFAWTLLLIEKERYDLCDGRVQACSAEILTE